jgi:ribosomal protein S4E
VRRVARKRLRPETFELTLPDGKKVKCWRKEADAIRRDVYATGDVFLIRNPETDVYERVPPEQAKLIPDAATRRVS